MQIFFIIFITLFAVLIGGHILIGFSLIKFFSLKPGAQKLLAIFTPVGLAIGFIASTAILNWYQAPLAKTVYHIFALWMGLAINLLLAFALGWILILLLKKIGKPINLPIFGTILIALALTWTIYGVWNANQIIVKTIEPGIANLPPEWKGKTAIQLSDAHLGAINGKDFSQKIVNLINKAKPDIVFITGDLFDGTCHDFLELASPLKELEAPLGTYFITGNHETYSGLNNVSGALSATPVKFIKDEILEINGLQIAGVNYPVRGFSRDIQPMLDKINNKKPSILLYHEPAVKTVEDAKKAGVSLMLSGHTHKGQVFPVMFITRLIYGDYYYGLYQNEEFSLYTTSGAGTWGPPLRTGNSPEIVKIIF